MALLRDIAVKAMQIAPWLETVATALPLSDKWEKGISEQAAGWQPTKYTRGGPLKVWAAENFDVAPGSREENVAVQQAKDAGTFYKTTTPIPPPDGGGGDTGGNVPTGPTGPTGPSAEEIARQELQSKLSAINARLQQMRDIAQRNIGTARGVRDEVVGNIGQTYANLTQQAQSRRNAALEALGQEDVGVQNLYGRAGGTARRAMESALTRNRMRARAMNQLNSSFYDQMQAATTEEARKALFDLEQEQAAKRAAIGTRRSETEDWFNQQASTIAQEEASLKSQAEREYQNQVNAAADMERAYGIDSLAAAEQAEREFSSKLAQIDAYIQDRGTQLIQLAAATGQNIGNVLNQYQAVNDTLSRALGINQALGRAQTLPANMPTFGDVATAGQVSNYLPWYQQQPQTPEDEVQQRLNQVFGYQ